MALNKQKILKNAGKFTKKGHYHKAIAEYRKLTQEDYGESSLNNTIGDLLVRAKNIQEAVIEYEKAGIYYEEKGFIPKALAIYKKILRHDSMRTAVYVKLAQLYSDQGLIQDAITQYEFLAKHFEHEKQIEKALDSYKQIADLDPSNLSIRERLANLYSAQDFKEKACIERVIIGERYMKRGNTVEAINSFEQALSEFPEDANALKGMVSVYLAENRVDDARNVLESILKKTPDNISALSTLGRLQMENDQLDEAIEVFKKVFQLDPSQDGINEILGKIYIQKGNYEEAFKLLKEIISLAIENEDYERALSILEQLQGLEPKNIAVRERKIEIYQKLDRAEDVKNGFREMAEIYYENSRLEEAYNIYDRLYSMDPHDKLIKQRFNQISIELRGRPVEISKLVEQPTFDSVVDDALDSSDASELVLSSEQFDIESDSNALESLFDTSEIEKISIPMFGDSDAFADGNLIDDQLADDIFNEDEGAGAPAVAETARDQIEPSEDQIREFRIEAGVFMKYGLLEKAADRLKSILVIDPEDEDSLEKLTEVYEKTAQMEQAVQTILRRSDLMIANNSTDELEALLNHGLELLPGNSELQARLSNLAQSAGSPASGDMAPFVTLPAGSDFEPLVDLTQMEAQDSEGMDDDTQDDSAEKTGGSLTNGLSDVVREFREELVQRTGDKDAETHYNLGIAYKEMGLVTEAIEEFKLTIDFPEYLVKSSGLLANCYLEVEDPFKAVSVINRALKSDLAKGMVLFNLKYELAQVRIAQDRSSEALKLLKEISDEKKNYRNVSKLIDKLEKSAE